MRLSNGFVIDKEKTFGELKFTAVRDVFLQNEDGTPSTQLKKRIYDLKCSLHGGIIPVSVPPEVPLREFPYNAVVELVNPVADTVSRNNQKRLRDLENGQCLLQDLYGRVGVVQIHPVFEELLHAFDTRPPVQRNEVE